MSYVFISHSHKDKEFARKLSAALRHAGHVAWMDEAEILVGDSLIEKIRDGLDRVEYVVAILSKASVESEWVKKELDVAMNREIGSKKVVVLPALVQDGDLPGFLQGKRYADFRSPAQFDTALKDLLLALGRADPPPALPAQELERLRIDLQAANALVESFAKDLKRQRAVIASHQSPRLRAAIDEANKKFSDHRTVNEAYAFEVGGMPVTLDYLLWAIAKERRRGHPHQLALLVQIEGKWDSVRLLLEAYQDYLGLTSDRKTGDAGRKRK